MLDFGARPQTVIEIVLTGGSCAGKTTALELVSRSLREKGHAVLCVPEAVTMLVGAGIPRIGEILRNDPSRACLFQAQVYAAQRGFRSTFRGLAGTFLSDTVVILYDRGELDGTVYHQDDCVARHAAAEGTSLAEIRDSYAAVMHLVTAADGAVDVYSGANNRARWDTPDEAVLFDRKLLRAWEGHPRHTIIDNSTDFVGKMERLVEATLRVIDEVRARDLVGTLTAAG